MKNLLVAQSGGPTAAINATLYGVIKAATENNVKKIYGARFGIKGVLNEDLIDLKERLNGEIELLKQTPASILGSCRFKLKNLEFEEEYEKILNIFRKYDIGYFIYIGGNDSMDTASKIAEYFKLKNVEDIFVIGAPKTIDNDIEITDHCPGFGSAAKFVATIFSELERDCSVYNVKAVTLVETMGRDAGWLTAASCLSRVNGFDGPSLIYLCEKEFSEEKFLTDIEEKLKEQNSVLVALSEGLKTKNGHHILEDLQKENKKDMFGHKQNAGVAKHLEEIVRENLGCKVRSVELNTPQRAAAHIASKTDILEASIVGEKAVEFALKGKTNVMVTILRKEAENYEADYLFTEIKNVANRVKKIPEEFISETGTNLTKKAVSYLKPLIKGEPQIKFENGIPLFVKIF